MLQNRYDLGIESHGEVVDPSLGMLVLASLLAAYFLPTLLAMHRRLDSGGGIIFFVNLFLGWTLIGWLVCLLWAAFGPTQARFYGKHAALRIGR